jgi:two-component system response regulator HydG
MATILVIDDDLTIREMLEDIISDMGHTVHTASGGAQGVALFRAHEVDFVISDLKMAGMDGVAVLKAIREADPDVPTMIMTAYGTVETAVEAMKLGAFDFITKGGGTAGGKLSADVVRLKVTAAINLTEARRARRRLEAENEYLRRADDEAAPSGELIGTSAPMRQVMAAVEKVAPTDASVLLVGESGTGKEMVSREIHRRSRRKDGPFIKVNCGALTDTLLESELFGHEKGAFTGAIKRKMGRFELADAGTLLLDEIGDITPALQLKLLRVLQEREFERVGGESTIRVDVRIISATNKDLAALVAAGQFRQDLYYRLHIVPVTLPPLRERREDIPVLVRHFIQKLAPKTNPRVKDIEDEALAQLMAYRWPGNVRELENVIEQSLVFSDGERIGVGALPGTIRVGEPGQLTVPRGDMSLEEILEDLERQLIMQAYEKAKGVKTETARLLGIKTSALYYKLQKYGIA